MEKRRKTLNEDYLVWLYSLIDNRKRSYRNLASELHKKPFRWGVALDENRYEDGLDLRRRFTEGMDETHLEVRYFLKGECTFLEMLIALAQRMNGQLYDLDTQEDKTPTCFQELLGNLGMLHFYDTLHFSELDLIKIDRIVEIVIDRSYGADGTGSLFPIKRRPPRDMSRVEIWYQMMIYLNENHGL